VYALPKKQRDLCPPPPERTEQNLKHRKGKHHVGTIEKMSQKENDCNDGHDREQQTGDEGQEKQENSGPERDLRLWSREFLAPATRTCCSVPGIHMQPGAELYVIAPAAKVAEQRLTDSDAIAVVAIFHGI
jgi:hypothetical protein